MTTERSYYLVTMRFRFPAWDEREGIVSRQWAASKSRAIAYARSEMRNAGHMGQVTFRAVLDDNQEGDLYEC